MFSGAEYRTRLLSPIPMWQLLILLFGYLLNPWLASTAESAEFFPVKRNPISAVFHCYAANLPTQQTFSNGATINYQYDNLLRTTDVWHKRSNGTTMGRYQYQYDNASNVTQRSDNDGSVTSFGYDGANQLTSETRVGTGPYVITYSYDGNGNRLTKVLNAVTENYSYDFNDKLTSAGSKSYQYDLNGNCTSVTNGGQTTSLTYDYDNRVTRIDFPGGGYNAYIYNGLGLRVRTQDPTRGTIAYLHDGAYPASPVIADSNANYTTQGGSERRGTVSKFYHYDALGSTRGITDSSQTATDSILYDGFGMTVSRTGTTPTPFGFGANSQYQTDYDSGLMLLGHRYYDASIGRFISQDRAKDGRNWYAYCDSNPLNRTDPTGMVWETVLDLIGTAADIVDFVKNPSPVTGGIVIVDIGGILVPGAPSPGGIRIGGRIGGWFAEQWDRITDGISNLFGGGRGAGGALSPDLPVHMGGTGDIDTGGNPFSGQLGPPEVAGLHLPHGKLQPVGTVGDIVNGGGSVILNPEPYRRIRPDLLNPGHVDVTLGPGYVPPGSLPPGIIDNPIPKLDRIPIRIDNGTYP